MVKRFSRTEARTRGSGSSRRTSRVPPPDVAGQVHFFGDRHLGDAPQEVLVRRPPDRRVHAGVRREVRQVTPEERRDQRERVGPGRLGMRGQRHPYGMVLPRGAISEDLLPAFRRRDWRFAGASGTRASVLMRSLWSSGGRLRPGSARATRPLRCAPGPGVFRGCDERGAHDDAVPEPRGPARAVGSRDPEPDRDRQLAGGMARPLDGAPQVAGSSVACARRSRAVRRRRETRSRAARLRASDRRGDVGDARKTVSSPARRNGPTIGEASSGGRSVTRAPSKPADGRATGGPSKLPSGARDSRR